MSNFVHFTEIIDVVIYQRIPMFLRQNLIVIYIYVYPQIFFFFFQFYLNLFCSCKRTFSSINFTPVFPKFIFDWAVVFKRKKKKPSHYISRLVLYLLFLLLYYLKFAIRSLLLKHNLTVLLLLLYSYTVTIFVEMT